MKSRLVTWQLRMFALITVGAVAIMAIYYVRLPEQFGVGRYDVSVDFSQTGGLYPKSQVTYRGHEVGTVRSLELRPDGGVRARLQIDDEIEVPADAVAEVRSGSVIGEQYINFVPAEPSNTTAGLVPGAVVPESQTSLPTTTDQLLNSLDALVASVPTGKLRTAVDELGKAFEGVGDDLGLLIEDGGSLADAAKENLEPTTRLIDNALPLLSTQRDLDPAIRSYARSLDALTGQLASSDDDIRAILTQGGPAISEVSQLTEALAGELPGLLSETAEVSEVARIYRDGIEHLFTVLPAATTMFSAAVPPSELHKDHVLANLFFKLSFPSPCTTGFPEKDKMRDPSDMSLANLPSNSYCKTKPDSPLVVRGARNNPCPQDPNRRGRTAAACGLVFDETAAERSKFVQGETGAGMAEPDAAQLFTPNGPMFLLDETAVPGPDNWADQLRSLVSR